MKKVGNPRPLYIYIYIDVVGMENIGRYLGICVSSNIIGINNVLRTAAVEIIRHIVAVV